MSSEIEKAAAIVWVKIQMAKHGLSFADLEDAGCFPLPKQEQKTVARYRDAEGRSWDGHGEMPSWLLRAVSAGQSQEHFRVVG